MFLFLWLCVVRVFVMLFLFLCAVMPVCVGSFVLLCAVMPVCVGSFVLLLGGVVLSSRPSLCVVLSGTASFDVSPLLCFTFFVGVCGTPLLCLFNDAAFQLPSRFRFLSVYGAMALTKASFDGYNILTSSLETEILPRTLVCSLRGHSMPVSSP